MSTPLDDLCPRFQDAAFWDSGIYNIDGKKRLHLPLPDLFKKRSKQEKIEFILVRDAPCLLITTDQILDELNLSAADIKDILSRSSKALLNKDANRIVISEPVLQNLGWQINHQMFVIGQGYYIKIAPTTHEPTKDFAKKIGLIPLTQTDNNFALDA